MSLSSMDPFYHYTLQPDMTEISMLKIGTHWKYFMGAKY